MGFIACWGIMVILTAFLLCQPLAYNWDQFILGGKCANERAAFIAVGVLLYNSGLWTATRASDK